MVFRNFILWNSFQVHQGKRGLRDSSSDVIVCLVSQILAGKGVDPSLQTLLLADAIKWTADVDRALASADSKAALRTLTQALPEKQVGDQKASESCRSVAAKSRQQVLQRLIAAPLDKLSGEWKKELRYTWHDVSHKSSGRFNVSFVLRNCDL